ncbi:MAG: hypothetical protein QXG00_05005 [Candidatus Woesearchaeota archaeon]
MKIENMKKFELTFELKQHTPLIHFQHSQEGATLRATEVKPKLDKFIIEKKGGKENFQDWFIDVDRDSLDYKIKIISNDVILKSILKGENIPLYYGNMGDEYDKNPKTFSFTNQKINIKFVSFNSEIIKEINNRFVSFIASTNFGTRQNKGFGSFFLNLDSEKHSDINIDEVFRDISYLKLAINKASVNFDDIKSSPVFNIINYYYQRLKSGINYSSSKFNHYQPSFLKQYLNSKYNYNWEKRWLKENFFPIPKKDDTKKFARIMLGLGNTYTFINKPNPNNKNIAKKNYPKNKLTINVKSEDPDFERFKSPITFKPIVLDSEIRIYIITNKIKEDIANKEFKFSLSNQSMVLSTPNKEEIIDVEDLIREYHKHLGTKFIAYTFSGKPNYQVEIK